MKELINPDYYANELRMRRSTHQGVFLIVEGDSDAKLYKQLIDALHCELVIARNRNMAISILEILQNPAVPGVVAIVDKDFDELNETLPNLPNLFFTDTHDLETMLLRSPALEKLLGEFASEEKLKNFERNLREVVLASGCSIGYLLWISLQDALSLKFEGIDFSKFIHETTLETDEEKLIQEVKNKSQKSNLDVDAVQRRVKQQRDLSHDLWQICRGHDFMSILSVGLRKTIGSQNAKEVSVQILERSLRLAYEQSYFQYTHLYAAIKIWEESHQPYRVFKIT